jgi:mono/diheme cytochrome c family protein
MQLPPANTIARALPGLQQQAVNPFSSSDAPALRRGEQVFKSFCVPCHGISGNGDGLVAKRGFPDTPSLVSARVINLTDDGIYSVITYGSATMPAHGGQIDREDRWKAILYVRKLQSGEK